MLNRILLCGAFSLLTLIWPVNLCSAVDIPVGNPSFEEPDVDSSSAVIDGPGSWAQAFGGGFADQAFLADPPLYPSQEGDYLGNIYVNEDGNFAALFQDVVRIEEGTYEFTVGVAHEPDAAPTSAPFLINFEAVGFGGPTTLLEENLFTVGDTNSNDLTDITATVEIPPGHPEIGRMFRPVLLTTGPDAGSNPEDPRGSYMMDNARLDFTPTDGPERSIRVGQPSFDPPVWNTPFGSGANATVYHPESQLFPSQEGDQLGALTVRDDGGWGAAFWQDTVPIEEGTYSLTVGVAHDPDFEPTTAPFLINFESVSETGAVTLLGENEFPFGSANSSDLTDLTATLEIPEGLPNIGETLRLVLLTVGEDIGSNPEADDPRATYLLDNVRLEFEPTGGSLLTADFDGDGDVDADDLTTWEGAYGMNADADADGDGDSDGSDFLVWQQQFGSSSTAAVAVPEPTSLCVLLIGLAMIAGKRSSRQVD